MICDGHAEDRFEAVTDTGLFLHSVASVEPDCLEWFVRCLLDCMLPNLPITFSSLLENLCDNGRLLSTAFSRDI